MNIVLVGNPNSGKTSLYNLLSGKNEKVGNFPGVTVSKKVSLVKKKYQLFNEPIYVIDLPGAYSLSSYTLDEEITANYLANEDYDLIINIVDATNLSRSMFLSTQIMELKKPLVVFLNKSDVLKKKGLDIEIAKLEKEFNVKFIVGSLNNFKVDLTNLVKECIKTVNDNTVPSSLAFDNLEAKERALKVDEFVGNLINKPEVDEKITNFFDNLFTSRYLGILIFALVMIFIFSVSQNLLGPYIADYLVSLIDTFKEFVASQITDASPFLQLLLLDGIIGGVGALLGFLPLVMILYFMIDLLDDLGYMARVASIMDPIFKKVGLSGRSIIPLIIGTGCAIPAIMASRTIKNERERKTTAILSPFMPCGAKLPVIVLFSSLLFSGSFIMTSAMYFLSILVVFITAKIVFSISKEGNKDGFFILELPDYKMPSFKRAFLTSLERAKSFVIKAFTIILVSNILISIIQQLDFSLNLVTEANQSSSILAVIASPFAFLLIPLGFGVWQLAAAAITGFIAKENVISTIAVVYSISNFINVDDLSLVGNSNSVIEVIGLTSPALLAYLIFILFTPPCFAALGALKSELEDKRWFIGGILLHFGIAYILSFIVYQVGTLILYQELGNGFIYGLIVVVSIILGFSYKLRKLKVS